MPATRRCAEAAVQRKLLEGLGHQAVALVDPWAPDTWRLLGCAQRGDTPAPALLGCYTVSATVSTAENHTGTASAGEAYSSSILP